MNQNTVFTPAAVVGAADRNPMSLLVINDMRRSDCNPLVTVQRVGRWGIALTMNNDPLTRKVFTPGQARVMLAILFGEATHIWLTE
jgi:hypothetical protein